MDGKATPKLLIVTAALLLAGCTEAGGPPPATPAGDGMAAGPAVIQRSVASANASFEAANGIPFYDVKWDSGCFDFRLHVPEGTTMLRLTLAGPAMDPARRGAGFMTFLLREEGDAWREPEDTVPREEVQMAIEAPPAGAWQVWVWPNGPVVHQTWQLTAAADVAGTGAVTLRPSDPGC